MNSTVICLRQAVITTSLLGMFLFAGPAQASPTGETTATLKPAAETKLLKSLDDVAKVLADARAAMAEGHLKEADALLKRAEAAKPKYPVLHFGDTPARVRRDLQVMQKKAGIPIVAEQPNGAATPDPRYGTQPQAAQPRSPAENALAEAVQANPVPAAPTAPADSAASKQQILQVLAQARAAMKRGDMDTARRISSKLQSLQIPEAQFAPEEDRPSRLAIDLDTAMMEKHAVKPASSVIPDALNFSDLMAPTEPTAEPRIAQVPQDQPFPLPSVAGDPGAQASQAFTLLQQGEEALRAGDRAGALQLFQQAYQSRNELDVLSQQRLQGHLQMLSPTSAGPDTGGLLTNASSSQSVLARQMSAEVGRRQSEASQIRSQDPARSLEILSETRELITASELDAETRSQLLRRIDLSLADTKKYIEDHGAELELDEANRKVLEEIERRSAVKAEVRQRIADMVDQFNKLSDEHRYAEAELVAKRLYEMAPEEPVAQQVWQFAKFLRREMLNQDIIATSEEGVAQQLLDVRQSAALALLHADDPFTLPDNWNDMVKDRKALSTDRRRSLRELQIEKKLQTPVLPQYTDMSLSQVMQDLSKQVGVNIHLDPRGLAQEGINSDTPVSLSLNQEISLESVLNLILEELHLTFMIDDEVLKITSEQIRDGDLYQRTYPVADLVIPIPNFVPSSNMGLQGLINDAYASMGYGPSRGVPGPVSVVANNMPNTPGVTGSANALAQQLGGTSAGGTSVPSSGPGGLGGAANADFDSLIDLITSTVEHDSWMENGTGEGEIQPFPINLSLVISQTQRVHEQIADLLEQLRRLQDLQVTIEVRFIRLTDDFFERIGMDFDFNIEDHTGLPLNAGTNPGNLSPFEPVRASASVGINNDAAPLSLPSFTADLDVPFRQDSFALTRPAFGGQTQAVSTFGFAILSDIEAYFLIEASQGDSRSNVLQAPKVTLFNGQQAMVVDSAFVPFVISVIPVVGEFAAAQQPVIVVLSEGTMMTVQAVVSDDRRYVRLTLVPFFSQIGDVDTFTFEGSTTSTSSSGSSSSEDDTGSSSSDEEAEQVITSGTTVQLPTFEVISVSTTVSVPDGGTVLLGGIKRLSEGRTEFGVPILSKVPYIDRLFRNVGIGRSTDSLMMMVTPRIIIQEEEEEKLGIVSE